MNFASLTDLIRPIGSVYFSSITWNFSPVDLFGGQWANSGTMYVDGEIFNVWHRLS
jgi:hypothetical protein